MAEKSYPLPKVRGGDRECQAASAQERPRGATTRPRSGDVAERSNPTCKVSEWMDILGARKVLGGPSECFRGLASLGDLVSASGGW